MITTFLLAVVLSQSPAHPLARCGIEQRQDAGHAKPFYVCDAFYGTGAIRRTLVTKFWFKAHCHAEANLANGDAAVCDEVFPGAELGDMTPLKDAAHPSKKSKATTKAIGYGLASVAVLAVCAIGGCGFMGGGA